jgi:hypothetical protein
MCRYWHYLEDYGDAIDESWFRFLNTKRDNCFLSYISMCSGRSIQNPHNGCHQYVARKERLGSHNISKL